MVLHPAQMDTYRSLPQGTLNGTLAVYVREFQLSPNPKTIPLVKGPLPGTIILILPHVLLAVLEGRWDRFRIFP